MYMYMYIQYVLAMIVEHIHVHVFIRLASLGGGPVHIIVGKQIFVSSSIVPCSYLAVDCPFMVLQVFGDSDDEELPPAGVLPRKVGHSTCIRVVSMLHAVA